MLAERLQLETAAEEGLVTACVPRFVRKNRLGSMGGSPPLPQDPRQRLEKLPADHAVLLDERAELPEGHPVTNKVARGRYCRDASPLVDERDLAEVVSGPESRPLLASH